MNSIFCNDYSSAFSLFFLLISSKLPLDTCNNYGYKITPTVMKLGAYRFHFYSDEGNEPPHIHVETPDGECKFWLDPVRLARNKGISPQNIRQIERKIFENRDFLEDKFHEYFSHEK